MGREGERVRHKRPKRDSGVRRRSKDKPGQSDKGSGDKRRKRATDSRVAKERRRKRGLQKISLPNHQQVDWMSHTVNLTASSGIIDNLMMSPVTILGYIYK